MSWYIVYKSKTLKSDLGARLDEAGVEYYVPYRKTSYYDEGQIKQREEEVLRNLIFINTAKDIVTLVNTIDGLGAPYWDKMTGRPAVVPDGEMERFMRFMSVQDIETRILQDPIQHFNSCQRVRVTAGDFAGVEGYVFRIRGDRKLVVALGDIAVAISGIHHSLLEPIENQ